MSYIVDKLVKTLQEIIRIKLLAQKRGEGVKEKIAEVSGNQKKN